MKKLEDIIGVKRVVIIEDNMELREAYYLLINEHAQYVVVGSYGDCESALKSFERDAPDIMLIDLNLPGMSGTTGIGKFKKLKPEVRILVVTVHDESTHVFDALCAGAIGYITKDSNHMEIISSIDQVANGGAPMSTKIAHMIVKSFHLNPHTPLTERETEVLKQLAQGKTYDYIAMALHISRDTVKTHIRHIYEKLQVNNKSEAVLKAQRENLV